MKTNPLIRQLGVAFAAVFLSGLPTWNPLAAEQSKRPNIVWIFSDDHAFQAIGAYGGRLQKIDPTRKCLPESGKNGAGGGG